MNVSPMCAVELLEIIKYLDDELKNNIPQNFEIYLNSIKDNSYYFKIDKNKKAIYIHPRVEIDGDIYTLKITATK